MLQQCHTRTPSFVGFACAHCGHPIPLIPKTSASLVAALKTARITVFAHCEHCDHNDSYPSSLAEGFGDSKAPVIAVPSLRDACLERIAHLESHIAAGHEVIEAQIRIIGDLESLGRGTGRAKRLLQTFEQNMLQRRATIRELRFRMRQMDGRSEIHLHGSHPQ